MSEFAAAFRDEAAAFGVDPDSSARYILEAHFDLLVRWNRKVNLTRITDARQAVRYHYLESLWLAGLLPRPVGRAVDVGSGAGFPGLPVAVALPSASVVLLEPNGKRATFLRECVRVLGLSNVRVVQDRFHAERVGVDDTITSRAVEQFRDVLPILLTSSARAVVVLASPELLATCDSSRRPVSIVPVPLARGRAAGVFGERPSTSSRST